MMILRSEMREEVRERRRDRGGEGVSFPGRIRDYEERVTYKTITRTEFQKRRASFESREEADGDGTATVRIAGLRKKTKSLDEIAGKREEDPYHTRFQEKEMTEKLEDIHRMIVDMQEMTRQLKDRNYSEEGKLGGKLRVKSLGMIAQTEADNSGKHEKPLLISGPALTVKPVRYRSTIVIVIGSQWQRFKEEIELRVDSPF